MAAQYLRHCLNLTKVSKTKNTNIRSMFSKQMRKKLHENHRLRRDYYLQCKNMVRRVGLGQIMFSNCEISSKMRKQFFVLKLAISPLLVIFRSRSNFRENLRSGKWGSKKQYRVDMPAKPRKEQPTRTP